ncbi:MAG: nicotinate (nicotinamide) nucleotide adenylyltransferase, partial [Verrucomicrobiota bacterium]
ILAETAFEKLKLDQLIFIPAKISPYKTNQPPAASAADRVAMIELAIAGRNGWSVDTRELFRAGPSFTIDTVKELQQEHREATFVFLIGEDQLAGFPGWKESEELQRLVSFVVLSRNSMTGPILRNSMADPILLDRCIDISSTEIRERLAKNKNVDYLLPSSIHDYIKTKKLYQKRDC